jgi:hypothetical protein
MESTRVVVCVIDDRRCKDAEVQSLSIDDACVLVLLFSLLPQNIASTFNLSHKRLIRVVLIEVE